jgi:hypothetical protein
MADEGANHTSKALEDPDGHEGPPDQGRTPVGAICVVVGWSLLIFLIGSSFGDVSSTLAVSTLLPMFSVLAIAFNVQGANSTTKQDRWNLCVFLFCIYVLGTGVFVLVELQHVEVQYEIGGANTLVSGLEDVAWIAFVLILIGVALAMQLLSGGFSKDRLVMGLLIIIGVLILIVLVIPTPVTYANDELPSALRPEQDFGADHTFTIPLWQRYVSRSDGGFFTLGIQLPTLMVGCLLLGLWGLARPDDARRAFGFAPSPKAPPPEEGGPSRDMPKLRLYGR